MENCTKCGHHLHHCACSAANNFKNLKTRKVDFCKVGDTGQQYEHYCENTDGRVITLGWSNHPDSFAKMVELHPCWHSHTFINRWKNPSV